MAGGVEKIGSALVLDRAPNYQIVRILKKTVSTSLGPIRDASLSIGYIANPWKYAKAFTNNWRSNYSIKDGNTNEAITRDAMLKYAKHEEILLNILGMPDPLKRSSDFYLMVSLNTPLNFIALSRTNYQTAAWGSSPLDEEKVFYIDVASSIRVQQLSIQSIIPISLHPSYTYAYILYYYMFGHTDAFDFIFQDFYAQPDVHANIGGKISNFVVHNNDSITNPYQRFFKNIPFPRKELIHVSKTCVYDIPFSKEKIRKLYDVLSLLRPLRSTKSESITKSMLDLHKDIYPTYQNFKKTTNIDEEYTNFYTFILSMTGVVDLVLPKFICTVHSKYGADSKTKLAKRVKLLEFIIDINNPLYSQAQKGVSNAGKKMQVEILDPQTYLNNLQIEVENKDIQDLLDNSDIDLTASQSGERNEFFDEPPFQNINQMLSSGILKDDFIYLLTINLAILPPIFYLPYCGIFHKNLKVGKGSFTHMHNSRSLNMLNSEFTLSSLSENADYYISCIVCHQFGKEYYTYIRDLDNDNWFIINGETSKDGIKKIDFKNEKDKENVKRVEAMLNDIRDNTIGIWCMRDILYKRYSSTF